MNIVLPSKDHAILMNDLLEAFLQDSESLKKKGELSHWGFSASEWAKEIKAQVEHYL